MTKTIVNKTPSYGTGFQAASDKADSKAFANWYRANNRVNMLAVLEEQDGGNRTHAESGCGLHVRIDVQLGHLHPAVVLRSG